MLGKLLKKNYRSILRNYKNLIFAKLFPYWINIQNKLKYYFRLILIPLIFKSNFIKIKSTIAPLDPEVIKESHKDFDLPLLQDYSNFNLATSSNPKVSIIIPIYNKINYTINCLHSIALNIPKTTFEIIVIDDNSSDDSLKILKKLSSIRLIKNESNLGFIRSCNKGAKLAKGKYLLFLNNDTEVKYNFLDELVRTFDEFPGTGLVGSKLLYPNNVLQEAGGILWRDGTAANFGRYQDASLPQVNYAREVDYCSGASIMVPKNIFEEVGAFDLEYTPAYCEDSDLAIKIRQKGYRVLYQPLSVVVHYEGISSGRDINKGIKAYQKINTEKLYKKWQPYFQTLSERGEDIENTKDQHKSKRVLVIDHCLPIASRDAGSLTVINLMLLFREMNYQVTFISNSLYYSKYPTEDLQRLGIEVLYPPFVENIPIYLLQHKNKYNIFLLLRSSNLNTLYLKIIRKFSPKTKILLHYTDLGHLRLQRQYELKNTNVSKRNIKKIKNIEIKSALLTDISIVHSQVEAKILHKHTPQAKIYVMPLSLDTTSKKYTGFEASKDLVFIGGYGHPPNLDAVFYFVQEVMPILRKKIKDVKFYIAGSHVPQEIKNLACEDIIVEGYVEDISSFFQSKRIFVSPLRYGAGVKGKVGKAMTSGLPIVATSISTESMQMKENEHYLLADDPETFANQIKKLYEDKTLWEKISKNGLEFAKIHWGEKASYNHLKEILESIHEDVPKTKHPLYLYNETIVTQYSSDVLDRARSPSNILSPIFSIINQGDWENKKPIIEKRFKKDIEKLNLSLKKTSFDISNFCKVCNNKKASFSIDVKHGGRLIKDLPIFNWQESLLCSRCHLNNRIRLIASILQDILNENLQQKKVYLMEQVTPLFAWVKQKFNQNHKILGSEYLGYQYQKGEIVQGLKHEDVQNLSFLDNELDIILSNDVFEHIPNPILGFSECFRVLKRGGIMLATFPFHENKAKTIPRAILKANKVEHILEPEYHGNPIDEKGSLVFTDFGWDILEKIKKIGFSSIAIDVYYSFPYTHITENGIWVFRFEK